MKNLNKNLEIRHSKNGYHHNYIVGFAKDEPMKNYKGEPIIYAGKPKMGRTWVVVKTFKTKKEAENFIEIKNDKRNQEKILEIKANLIFTTSRQAEKFCKKFYFSSRNRNVAFATIAASKSNFKNTLDQFKKLANELGGKVSIACKVDNLILDLLEE